MAAPSLKKPLSLLVASDAVLRMHLDNVEVHPCDVNNDRVRAEHCLPEILDLFLAVQHVKGESAENQADGVPASTVNGPSAEALAVAIEQNFVPKVGGSHAQGYNNAIADIVSALRAGGYDAVIPATRATA